MSSTPETGSTEAAPQTRSVKTRPWLAGLLSLICSGLGQLYANSWRTAIALSALSLFTSAIFHRISVLSYQVMLASLAAGLVIYLGIFVDAILRARKIRAQGTRKPVHPAVAIGYFAAFMLISWLTGLQPHSRAFSNPSGSMAPAIVLYDEMMADVGAYKDAAPARGDIVVFRYPRDEATIYVKRIVALPGDKISIKNRVLTLNGTAAVETPVDAAQFPQLKLIPEDREHILNFAIESIAGHSRAIAHDSKQPSMDFPETTIPENQYFVLGDNRDYSNDSRFWGNVPRQNIIAKVKFTYMNVNRVTGKFQLDLRNL